MREPSNKDVFDLAMQQLHAGQPDKAAETCRSRLLSSPDDVHLLTLRGVALIGARKPAEAMPHLQHAVGLAPGFAPARENFGHALLMLGHLDEAYAQLKRAVELDPKSASAHQKMAHVLATMGKGDEAEKAFQQGFALDPTRERLAQAGRYLREEKFAECETLCKEVLQDNPKDVNAIRMLARMACHRERWRSAEKLLRRVLDLAPHFHDARIDLSRVLKSLDRIDEAVDCTATAAAEMPRNAYALYTHASMLAAAGQHEASLEYCRRAIQVREHYPAAWIGMGHVLKTLGQTEEGISAYKKAIEQAPNFGEVYWSLANLKTYRFTEGEVADMEQQLATGTLTESDRVHFLFTLGKAYEDEGRWHDAFSSYEQACAIQRKRISYDAVEASAINHRICQVFSQDFLREREGLGCKTGPVPIFILGLPRSGSTLIEQILASHSQVEGTAELPDIRRLTSALSRRFTGQVYPEAVTGLTAADWLQQGEEYLARTRRLRQGSPFFTDKMPNNFPCIGFILTILPEAKIIDARRHPMDSCLGSLKQHFAQGQAWSYDLREIGEYYLDYRKLMRHWHQVLPGKILEVRYEDLVSDQLAQTRRLLDFCGLPWEDACLRFYETERAVRTASSDQVRQPLYSSSINHWKNFSAELQPLRDLLSEELEAEAWDTAAAILPG